MQIEPTYINPVAVHLMGLMNQAGFESRVCGGAVRDAFLGINPKDWDIATTARPEQVMQVMNNWNVAVIPTGLQHGTVTAVMDGENYEITTLRIDQETDGRHAIVEYTTNWELDAKRRDFTMNALYMDEDGVVYDYFDGISDLKNQVVRFVGNSADRIQEDYLRILRYFRFRAKMLVGDFLWSPEDEKARGAIVAYKDGLKNISGERIWSEIKQIVTHHNAREIITGMDTTGVLDVIGLAPMMDRLDTLPTMSQLDVRPAVLVASCFPRDEIGDWAKLLKHDFHASRDEFGPVEFAVKHKCVERNRHNAVDMLAFSDKSDVLAWAAIQSRFTRGDHSSRDFLRDMQFVQDFHRDIQTICVPEFPVRGQDLLDMGIPAGPQVGRILKELKQFWAASEFSANRDQLINSVVVNRGETIT